VQRLPHQRERAARRLDDGRALALRGAAVEAHAEDVDAGVGDRRGAGADHVEVGDDARITARGERLREADITAERLRERLLLRARCTLGVGRVEVEAHARDAHAHRLVRALGGGLDQRQLARDALVERLVEQRAEVDVDAGDRDVLLHEAVDTEAIGQRDRRLLQRRRAYADIDDDLVALEADELDIHLTLEQRAQSRGEDEAVREPRRRVRDQDRDARTEVEAEPPLAGGPERPARP